MQTSPPPFPKPRSPGYQPELTHLPTLYLWRRLVRKFLCWLSRFLVYLWTLAEVNGLENLPEEGPGLVVANHLGDADVILGMAYAPGIIDPVAKMELRSLPVLGWLMDTYGVIWIHRGRPDRRALKAILQGLSEGRLIAIAPEGRESMTGSLEEGTRGAAYIALKANTLLIPVTFTGTENKRVYHNIKRFRRTAVSLTIGNPFRLHGSSESRQDIDAGTSKIMLVLASQLPPAYRGVYGNE